jgi:heme exporter protein B
MTTTFRLSLDQLWAIIVKDWRAELRARQVWVSMGFFALLALVVFNFAFDLRVENKASVGPGALWVAFLFASVLGLGRTVGAELDHGSMDRLLLCPVDRQVIYLAKLLGNLVFILIVQIVAIPIFAVIYDVPVLTPGIIPIVALGTLGIAAVGALFAAVSAQTRAREVLAPLLTFPLVIPVIIAAVKATEALVQPVANDAPWLGLLAAFAIIYVSLGALTFQYVVED